MGERKSKQQKEPHVQKSSGKEKLAHPARVAGVECVRRLWRDWRGRAGPHVTGPQRPKKTWGFILRAMKIPIAELQQRKDLICIVESSSGCAGTWTGKGRATVDVGTPIRKLFVAVHTEDNGTLNGSSGG